MFYRRFWLASLILAVTLPLSANAGDFCIYSRVFVDKGKKESPPPIESVTIFQSGRVYDFLDSPAEVTVFDPPGNKFVILDTERQLKTEVATSQIDEFVAHLKDATQKRGIVPLLAFLAEPTFEEDFDPTTSELTMKSPWLTYRVKTVSPKLNDASDQYAEYANWQAKLNMLLRPGSLPLFTRLELNKALDRRGLLPTEVSQVRHNGQSGSRRDVTLRAEHRLQWRLLDAEQKRVNEAATWLVTFKTVDLGEYQKPYLPKQPEAAAGE
jgi:hypothetical protein